MGGGRGEVPGSIPRVIGPCVRGKQRRGLGKGGELSDIALSGFRRA